MTPSASSLFSKTANNVETPSLRQVTLKVAAVNGINLSQGTCQLPVPPTVINAAKRAMDAGVNRYTSARGLQSLREAIAEKLKRHNNFTCEPETEIVITCGATGAFEGVCMALLDPGDEVISFEPHYPYHHNAFKRFGAKVSYIPLEGENWNFDRDRLAAAFSPKTKFILVNTPSNPCGKVFTREELEFIGNLCERNNALLVTDEIYEYMTFDNHEHVSPASIPGLRERTVTMGGYSKTFAITGWRIGYLVASPHLADKISQLLDLVYVCAPAPFQQAVADSIDEFGDDFYSELRQTYSNKREFFADALVQAGFSVSKPQGTYYMVGNYKDRFPNLQSKEFVNLMIERTRVGAVPVDDFVSSSKDPRWVRFCFAVEDDVLARAAQQLKSLN